MLKKQVEAATTRPMDTSRWQAMLMLGKPTPATLARIYIQNIQARNLARRNADQRARVFFPQLAQGVGIAGGVFKSSRRCWLLSDSAREAWQAMP
jgi:hypothetical protein